MMDKRNLIGRKEISAYTRRSWGTVKEWIGERHFPAKKLDGVWTSSAPMIDFGLEDQIKLAEDSTKPL